MEMVATEAVKKSTVAMEQYRLHYWFQERHYMKYVMMAIRRDEMDVVQHVKLRYVVTSK